MLTSHGIKYILLVDLPSIIEIMHFQLLSLSCFLTKSVFLLPSSGCKNVKLIKQKCPRCGGPEATPHFFAEVTASINNNEDSVYPLFKPDLQRIIDFSVIQEVTQDSVTDTLINALPINAHGYVDGKKLYVLTSKRPTEAQ